MTQTNQDRKELAQELSDALFDVEAAAFEYAQAQESLKKAETRLASAKAKHRNAVKKVEAV
jgi:hypothetical protein